MARSKPREVPTLASRWSPPDGAGRPLACVATTYTFHAPLFEADLLPRFLGLKFDATEGGRPFFVEREDALGTARMAVLVDQQHVDPSQTTLRWDQLSVRVPGGVQHAKVTLLAWERCARLLVGSANLTRNGFRHNRETVACLDFRDDPNGPPRRLVLDALDFLEDLITWAKGTNGAIGRLREMLSQIRALIVGWSSMPESFTSNEKPRAYFLPCLPARDGQERRSPLEEVLAVWGGRRANEIVVMTPFVGESVETEDPVVQRLVTVPHTRAAIPRLVVPGIPSEEGAGGMVVPLPRRFRDAWARAWKLPPEEIRVHVPRKRPEEKQRELHAKGLLLVGDNSSLLLCGSSNFSPHGMGIGAANVEANLCFLDRTDRKADGLRLRDRLTDGWVDDEADWTIWQEEDGQPPDDEADAGRPRLPEAFLWAALDQRKGILTLGLDPATLPDTWSIRLVGEKVTARPPLASEANLIGVSKEARGPVTVPLPAELGTASITCLAVHWIENGEERQALLPVQVERTDHLLPPEEFRSLSAETIMACLLSGRNPAELVEQVQRQHAVDPVPSAPVVDLSGYTLYRVRRMGRALAMLGERLLRTVRTTEATEYRLQQDPLGPLAFAVALKLAWGDGQPLQFALAEIRLTLAHVAWRVAAERRENEPDLAPLYRKATRRTEDLGTGIAGSGDNLKQYIAAVSEECRRLMGATEGECHAG